MSDEPRWHFHSSRRGEDWVPRWRHGGAWLTGYSRGLRNRPHNERRRDLRFSTEWYLFPPSRSRFGWGAQVTHGSPGGEDDLALSLYASFLGSLWLHASGMVPRRFAAANYDDRVAGITVSSKALQVSLYAKDGSWSRNDPWWAKAHYWPWERTFFGKTTSTQADVASGSCVIPMPEGSYPATFKTTKYSTRWPHRLGRLRGERVHFSTEVTPGRPVPVPGKGENSWDCGDDAIHALSVGGRSVEHAVGALVESALKTRSAHGGMHMNAGVSE